MSTHRSPSQNKGPATGSFFWLPLLVFFLFPSTGFSRPVPARVYARTVAYARSRAGRSWRVRLFQRDLDEGRRRMERKDYSGAILYFRRALRLGPRSTEARRLLRMAEFEQQYQAGLRYQGQDKMRYAEYSLRRALRIAMNPGMRAQANLASLQLALLVGARAMRSKDYGAAARSYEKALALSPNNHNALAGLTEARFSAAYEEGLQALSAGDFDHARARFRECLVYKPGAADALKEISRVNRIEKDAAEFESDYGAANASIDRGAWNAAERHIKRLTGVMQEADRLGFHSPMIFRFRPLLPAYVSYTDGDFVGAYQLAQGVRGKAESARAANFCRFLQSRRRFDYLDAWAPALLGGYLAILLGSIFAGLRRVLAAPRQAAN